MARRWQLNLIDLRAPEPSPGLWQTDTHACCQRHEVDPLFAALAPYDVWFTALRRVASMSSPVLTEGRAVRVGPVLMASLRRRFDPNHRSVVFFRQNVNQSVRSLADVADALMEVLQDRFPAQFP